MEIEDAKEVEAAQTSPPEQERQGEMQKDASDAEELFDGKAFYLDPELSEVTIRLLTRYILGYGGDTTDCLESDTDIIVTGKTPIDPGLVAWKSTVPSAKVVTVDWVQISIASGKLCTDPACFR